MFPAFAEVSFGAGIPAISTARKSPSAEVHRSSLQRQAVSLEQLSGGSERTSRRQTHEQMTAERSSSSSGGALGAGSAGSGSNGAKPLPAKTPSVPQMTAMGDVRVGRMSMQVKVSEGATKKVSSEQLCVRVRRGVGLRVQAPAKTPTAPQMMAMGDVVVGRMSL